ncbi:chemotaxis protein CheA [uncultured Jannaschia sp.]|uniref:chemotaxis protein CheA n=1 Tax=uncultured Jannaschia sp. TaxID=293347 RepID=UPI0026351C48|nr:chemotaxis protein CheA [uncultured Jannaschia sp.]
MTSPADSFIQEATDILEGLEAILLELEAEPDSASTVDAVFRALHTLKGSGAMFGFDALARFTHHFENAYDRIREGQAQVTPELIQLSLASRDHIERMIAAGPGAEDDPASAALVTEIEKLAGDASPADASEPVVQKTSQQRFVIRLVPDALALRNGTRLDLLLDELCELGDAVVTCHDDRVPPLREMDPTVCHLWWTIELDTSKGRDAIDEVFIFASDCEIEIEDSTPDAAPQVAPVQEAPEKTAPPQTKPAAKQEDKPAAQKSDSVRVQSQRLDELMDQLGELVIAQARLNRIAGDLGDAALAGTAEEIENLVSGLRDSILSIRMLPIEPVFTKFRRVVRDLSTELGKAVTLKARGGETEVDKNVIDSLTEPLVHIIRNSIDHGIELPEARRAAGKPEQARVDLHARQSGGKVLISIADDGAGLDAEAIRDRAVERGLIAPDAELSEEQLYGLIFEPGFSTAKTLSSVSGRGVGMDAVRRVIEDLQGTVEVRSQKGVGTEVTLCLPLTLAIIDGLLVKVGEESFVVPLSSVEECVELPPSDDVRASGRSILRIRDELVPFLSLDRLFGFERLDSDDRRVVITSIEGRRMGLVVDQVIGQYQTVIKPLSIYHRNIEGLAGSTILGDGSVALILDAAAVVRRAISTQRVAA